MGCKVAVYSAAYSADTPRLCEDGAGRRMCNIFCSQPVKSATLARMSASISRSKRRWVVLLLCTALVIYFTMTYFRSYGRSEHPTSLTEAVFQYASNKTIVIASVEVTYLSMALNLYMTSFKPFSITNHLFVASDAHSCVRLREVGAHCLQYLSIEEKTKPSLFGSVDYNVKTCTKPRIVLQCLKIGLNVLLVDLDIVFMKNPLPLVPALCPDCDIIVQDVARNTINSGFFFVKPTPTAIKLFVRTVELIPNNPQDNDQVYLNEAAKELQDQIRIYHLPADQYPTGMTFYIQSHRMFIGDNPCKECVIVHNNNIISVQAKVYRFREYGQWIQDQAAYYSDKKRRYIKYENPVDFQQFQARNTKQMELIALKNALIIGRILNRTLILPKFHCQDARRYEPQPQEMCHFAMHYSVRSLESHLPTPDTYREHVFLQHRLVPESTKKSVSDTFVIDGPVWQEIVKAKPDLSSGVRILKPSKRYATVEDIRKWFSGETSRILVFHSLYDEIDPKAEEIKEFKNVLKAALTPTSYMQIW